MKNTLNKWHKILLLAVCSLVAIAPAMAQDINEEKEAKVEQMLQNQNFVFKAQSASPMRGRTVQLTSDYDVVVSKDKVSTFLPYFGRAYSAQAYTGEGGIKITTTEFDYDVENKKKKRWNVIIEPKDESGVQQLLLSVSENGYATLQVISTNRDAISFNGYITQKG